MDELIKLFLKHIEFELSDKPTYKRMDNCILLNFNINFFLPMKVDKEALIKERINSFKPVLKEKYDGYLSYDIHPIESHDVFTSDYNIIVKFWVEPSRLVGKDYNLLEKYMMR